MTDPSSPAAVTEERIAEIRANVAAAIDHTYASQRSAAKQCADLLAALDARGLELARLNALLAKDGEIIERVILMERALEAAEAECARLEQECFSLAAGQCIITKGGLTNDDYGNQFCAMERRALAAEARLAQANEALAEARERSDAAHDRAYLNGLRAGWNMGLANDNKSFDVTCANLYRALTKVSP